jgi:hypothetical protein
MNRRHLKPRTVAGLSGAHLGMAVRIEGVVYRLTFISHSRREVRIVAEWNDPDDEYTYLHGDRAFPPGTPCTVVDWTRWFRPRRALFTTENA